MEAVNKMKNGCILCGTVGSGKSRTSLAYYYLQQGGVLNTQQFVPLKKPAKDLYIITTARKRDTFEWEDELVPFELGRGHNDIPGNEVVIDSWNNIKKYADVVGAFFIFDEQRVVGRGEWVKAFLKIAKHNEWILLSATPGDTWSDYIPVFIANGFFKNRTEFNSMHVVFSRYTKYPKVEKYLGVGHLMALRNKILITMTDQRKTVVHNEDIFVGFDPVMYQYVLKERKNPWTKEPIENASEYCYTLREVVNKDPDRILKLLEIYEKHPRIIVFYNFNYERDMLRETYFGKDVIVAEWNGEKHEPLPISKKWVYLVQYAAGNEGWNCTTTDTIVFFSQNYSYRIMTQAAGRINRLNTPYIDLYCYSLKSRASIDQAIARAIKSKKIFNASMFSNAFQKGKEYNYEHANYGQKSGKSKYEESRQDSYLQKWPNQTAGEKTVVRTRKPEWSKPKLLCNKLETVGTEESKGE